MSISNTNRKAGPYSGNGSTTQFPFSFKVFTTADVRVVLADSNGVESDLALGTNYTVALNADQDANPGGTVTTTATYATGYKVTLTSQVQNLQPVTLTNQGGFYPRVINDALDRATILIQQLAEAVARSLKSAISTPAGVDSQLPAPVPYALISWNAEGTGFQNADPTYANALSTDLASVSDGKGGALVGFKQAESSAAVRNTLDKLRERHSLADFGAASVLTVHVPTDYATLQAAINALHPLNLKPSEYVDIVIESGHALTAGLLVSHGDYSGFRISSVDATVNLASGFVPVDTATDGVSNYYAVMKVSNAIGPVWNILVNCATSSTLIGRALMYVDQSSGVINSGKGAIGATRYNGTDNGAGLYVLGSSVTGRGSVFTGNTRGAWITRGATADLESAVFDNSYTIGLYASRGCGVGWEFGSAKACQYGVDANRSMVMAANSTVDNCTNVGYLAENGGILDATGGSAKNCTNYGASAENSGVVHARNVDASGAGVNGFRVIVGGKLDKTGGTGTAAIAENLQRREGLITDNAIANPMTTSGGTLTFDTTQGKIIQGLRFRSGVSLTVADQAAVSLDMLISSVEWGCLLIASSDVGNGHPNGIIRYRVGSSPQITNVSLATTTNITLTTGALTGTTGTSGNFTISTHTDGKIYLENRTGTSKSIRLFTSG